VQHLQKAVRGRMPVETSQPTCSREDQDCRMQTLFEEVSSAAKPGETRSECSLKVETFYLRDLWKRFCSKFKSRFAPKEYSQDR
jgi:hypothetical protein